MWELKREERLLELTLLLIKKYRKFLHVSMGITTKGSQSPDSAPFNDVHLIGEALENTEYGKETTKKKLIEVRNDIWDIENPPREPMPF